MTRMKVENRRLKMSPGGVITLPVSARRALAMERRAGTRVTVAVDKNAVVLRPSGPDGGFRVSPRGQMELQGDARDLLASGNLRHYWLELDDESATVTLHPAT